MATGATVHVRGLKELVRAFDKMDRDLTQDLVDELTEAADPARKLTEQYVTGELEGAVGQWAYIGEMRIGVSRRQSSVWIAPAWRRDGSRPQLAPHIRKRMERAVENKADEIEKKIGHFLDTLADDWGSHLAA